MQTEIKELIEKFADCKDVLIALGDETRIHILTEMLNIASVSSNCHGLRVKEIAKISNLSRPAISHHVKILRESGIIKCRREGSMNFYYLDPDDTKLKDVITCLSSALAISQEEKKQYGHS